MKPLGYNCLYWVFVCFLLLQVRDSEAQQNNANLSSLTLSAGVLTPPPFAPNDTSYTAAVGYGVTNLTLTAVPQSGSASMAVQINSGGFSNFGSVSGLLALNVGTNLVEVRVTSGNFSVVKIYQVVVTRSGPPPPNVQTLTAVVGTGIETLRGVANPQGSHATAWFEWGTTTNYGNRTPPQALGSGFSDTNLNHVLNGLIPWRAYHFRAVCSNSLGVAVGSNAGFTLTNELRVDSGPAGGGQPYSTWQPALELNYLIRRNGLYPSTGGSVAIHEHIGKIVLFAGNFAPASWLFCHGQLLPISDNDVLFSLLDTTYGGNGMTTFALPDLRSRAVRGIGQGAGIPSVDLGEQSGFSQRSLITPQLPAHSHALPLPYGGISGSNVSNFPLSNDQPYVGIRSLIIIGGNAPSGPKPFQGQMTFFAGDFAPSGTAESSGQVLTTNQYPVLYSLLGTNYGWNGSNAFALPDMRGRVPMGIGQGPGLSARSLAQKVGAASMMMAPSQLPAHQHAMPGVPPLAPFTGFTGSNQPLSLVQPSLALRFLIATNGEVPSPSVEATNTMLGEIQLFAGTTVPSGWASCDGQVLNIATHPALFGVISNFYGGNGVTTFALPDLRGRIPVGSPTGQPGAAYGVEEFVLTEAQMPSHNHSVPALEFFGWGGYFGLSGADAGFESDPDTDGVKNGYEWATGTDPVNATSFAPLTIRASTGQAKVGFTRNTNATDVTIHLQRTIALGNTNAWSGLVTNVLGVWSAAGIVTESGTNSVKSVEVSNALSNNPAADYRLKVTRP